jgi:oligoribonuclease (3'-5' exoribonuclease)
VRFFQNVTMPLLLTLLTHRMNDYSTVTDLARLRGLSTS